MRYFGLYITLEPLKGNFPPPVVGRENKCGMMEQPPDSIKGANDRLNIALIGAHGRASPDAVKLLLENGANPYLKVRDGAQAKFLTAGTDISC